MGCFFNCFGLRDDRSSHSNHTKSKGNKTSENRLSSLFLAEERADSLFPNEDRGGLKSIQNDKGHKDETKFLESCGTTLGTPQLNEKLDEPPSPLNACEELGRHSFKMEQTPSSCMTNDQNSGIISSSCEERSEEQETTGLHEMSAGNTRGLNKSVLSESYSDAYSSSGFSTKICPEKLETVGKTGDGEPPIRSSVPDQSEGLSLSMVPEESTPMNTFIETQAFNGQKEGQTDIEVDKVEETAPEKDLKVETGLSPGMKSPPTSNEEYNENVGALSSKTPSFGKPRSDRPIIGLVALHWNEEESSHVSGWDGNGIPNSTNKYKEDQKVSWHATSFEERLEKALSEESFTSQRKRFGGTQTVLDENEGDTAASQLRCSANANPVASF